MATQVKVEEVEKQLESMLDIEKFPPPEDFRKDALVTDESVYEEAARDLEGFWARQAEELVDWIEKPTEILDESNVPFYKWFADGKLNLSYNCIDRHVEAGNGDRVAYHWRGEEGGPRLLVPRGEGKGGRGVPPRATRGRAPPVRPLHLRLNRQAQGRAP